MRVGRGRWDPAPAAFQAAVSPAGRREGWGVLHPPEPGPAISAELFAVTQPRPVPLLLSAAHTEREQGREGSLKMLLAQSWAGSEPWVCSSCLMQELSSCSAPGCPVRGSGTRLRVLTGLCFPADSICSCLCNPCKNSWVEPCCWLLGGAFFMESQSQ